MSDRHPEAASSLEAIRRRPGMYIGDVHDGSGLLHMVWELLANAVDEHLAGHAHHLTVTLHADDSVTIEDDGRGISVALHASGLPIVEVALTVLHASATLDGHTKHVHLGLHGVGMVAVNALSSSFVVEIAQGGKLFRQTYETGVATSPLAVVGATTKTGTRLLFKPDPAIFSRTEMDAAVVRERLREIACFNPGLVVRFIDEHTDLSEPRGIVGLAERLARGSRTTPAAPLYARGAQGHIGVEVALSWCLHEKGQLRSFVNQTETREGGTHVTGARKAWAVLLRDAPVAERKRLVKHLDARATGIICVTHHDPEFDSPTKSELRSPDVQPVVESVVKACIEAFAESRPDDVARLLEAVRTSPAFSRY